MKILLLMPEANINKISLFGFRVSLREAPLTLTTLAALIPGDINAECTLIDESIEKVPHNKTFDIVAISCMTGTAVRAYYWADYFRARGTTVVIGGVHATLCPGEAGQHADSIVTGFAELVWKELIYDFMAGNLQSQYTGGRGDFSKLPEPRRKLQRRLGYTIPYTVAATRGCGNNCGFCAVQAADFGWSTRAVGEVIDDIRKIPNKRFTFSDVNLLHDREYALELLAAIAPLNKIWGGLAMLATAEDEELLEALQKSGCQYLLCGFESATSSSLSTISKPNKVKHYANNMKAFHAHGISIQGCFIFGLDADRKDVFKQTVDLVNEIKIDIPRYAICTPYPGTKIFRSMEKENRLLHKNWKHYDTQHVVIQPKHMSPQELDKGFFWAYRETFKLKNIQNRMKESPHPLVSGVGNLAYRLYLKKLSKDKIRIIEPTSWKKCI